MAIKRSTSTSPSDTDTKDNMSALSPSQSDDIPADTPKKSSAKRSAGEAPSTPNPRAKARKTSTAALPSGSKVIGGASPGGVNWSAVEGLTPEKREALVDHLISVGSSSVGMTNLAEMFNVPKVALSNAIQSGRPSNLRGKLLKTARGV